MQNHNIGAKWCIERGDSDYVEGEMCPVCEPERANTFELVSVGEAIVEDRQHIYGPVLETFPRIAQVWSGILGVEVGATDVPLMLIGMKTVRAQVTPNYSDSSDDIEGFLDIFRQLVGPDMVQARTVEEYRSKRAG